MLLKVTDFYREGVNDIIKNNFKLESKVMSKSKMQELIEIVEADQKKTYEYLNKNFIFMDQLRTKLVHDLGSSDNISFANPEGESSLPKCRVEDSITIKDNGFFEFWLLISIPVAHFNSNNSGRIFIEKGLAPPSGVALLMAFKQHNNSFIVEVLDNNKKRTFPPIDIDIDNTWIELLDWCFVSTKEMIQGGLEKRIRELGTLKDNGSKKLIGYRHSDIE